MDQHVIEEAAEAIHRAMIEVSPLLKIPVPPAFNRSWQELDVIHKQFYLCLATAAGAVFIQYFRFKANQN